MKEEKKQKDLIFISQKYQKFELKGEEKKHMKSHK